MITLSVPALLWKTGFPRLDDYCLVIFAAFYEQDIMSTLLTGLVHQFGLHDRSWSSLCFSGGCTVLTLLVERRCFDLCRSSSGQDRNIVIFRVERFFLRCTEEAGPRANQPFQRKNPLSQVGSSYRFKLPAAGYTWCRGEYCNCVGVRDEHFAPALYERSPRSWRSQWAGCPWTATSLHKWLWCPPWHYHWNGCFAAVHHSSSGIVYPCPDSAFCLYLPFLPREKREWPRCLMLTWLDAYVNTLQSCLGRWWCLQEALLRGLWGSLLGSWIALVFVFCIFYHHSVLPVHLYSFEFVSFTFLVGLFAGLLSSS